jgi:hypothetical protein
MLALPPTFGVSLRFYWVIDDDKVSSSARYGSMDTNREIFTTATRGPCLYRALILCDTKPQISLFTQYK